MSDIVLAAHQTLVGYPHNQALPLPTVHPLPPLLFLLSVPRMRWSLYITKKELRSKPAKVHLQPALPDLR